MEPTSSFDWSSFFSLFWNEKGIKCKLCIPDTIIFRYGQVSAWWATTKDGWVQRRVSTTVSLEGIRKHFLQQAALKSRSHQAYYAAIVRSADGRPRLLRAEAFSELCLLLQRKLAGAAGGAAAAVEIPSVIQLYMQPLNDLRYITTYTNHGQSITCSTFQRKYSRRYIPSNSIAGGDGGGDMSLDDRFEAPEGVTSVEPTVKMQLRKMTHHLVKYIERAHGLTLLGLMCEYIKDASGRPVLLSVLRTEWASTPSGHGAGSYSMTNLVGSPEEEPSELTDVDNDSEDGSPPSGPNSPMSVVGSFNSLKQREGVEQGGRKMGWQADSKGRGQGALQPSSPLIRSGSLTKVPGLSLRPRSPSATQNRAPEPGGPGGTLPDPSMLHLPRATTAPSPGGRYGPIRAAPIITAQLAKEVEALRDDLLFQHDLAEASAAKVRQLEREKEMMVTTFEQRIEALQVQVASTQLKVQDEQQSKEDLHTRCHELDKEVDDLKQEKAKLLSTLETERATVLSTLRDYHMREADLRSKLDHLEQENNGLKQSLKEEQITCAAFRRQLAEYQEALQTFASKQLDSYEFSMKQVLEYLKDMLSKTPSANAETTSLQKHINHNNNLLRNVFVHYTSMDGTVRWPPSLSFSAFMAFAKDTSTADMSAGNARIKSNQYTLMLGAGQCEGIFQALAKSEFDGYTTRMLMSYEAFIAACVLLASAVKPPHINSITEAFKQYVSRYVVKAKKSSAGVPPPASRNNTSLTAKDQTSAFAQDGMDTRKRSK